MPEKKFLQQLHNQIHISGTSGVAIGRNIYQRPLDEAIRMADAVAAVVLYDYSVDNAYKIFLGKAKLSGNPRSGNSSLKSFLSLSF